MLKGILICGMVAMATALIPFPDLGSTCAATLCQVGTTCEERTGTDGVTRARCVVVKPGKCPAVTGGQLGVCAFTCSSDSDCSGQNKCCSNGCGGTSCTAPVVGTTPPPRPSCKGKVCPAGQKCVLRSVICAKAPCYPQPTCVDDPKPAVKPGKCPAVTGGQPGVCAFTCSSDSDCSGQNKCCRNGCGGTSCTAPVVGTTPPSCRGKVCPAGQKCVLKTVYCFTTPCYPQPTCVDNPKPLVKPGRCPSVGPYGPLQQRCPDLCSSDGDCSGDNKCCRNKCWARSCQAPVVVTTPPPRVSCRTVKCRAGYVCKMTKPSPWCYLYRRCSEPRPICVPDPQVCPKYPSYLAVRCAAPREECSKLNPCVAGSVCCPHPCGSQCVASTIPRKG